MKFTRLSTKFKKLLNKQKRGKTINPGKLSNLERLLTEKKDRYENKLNGKLSTDKRESLKTRLKVVKAHLKKLKSLA